MPVMERPVRKAVPSVSVIRSSKQSDGRHLSPIQVAELFGLYTKRFPASKGKLSFSTFQSIIATCGPETGVTEIAN